MKDINTTEQNINQAIDWLQKTGGQIQDFATTQTPLYCQEVVAWTFWSGFIYCMIGLIMILIATTLSFKLVKWFKEDGTDGSFRTILGTVVCVIFPFIGSGIFAHNISDTIKAKVAPRMIIVEHLKELVK